jgi:hypothetical protein
VPQFISLHLFEFLPSALDIVKQPEACHSHIFRQDGMISGFVTIWQLRLETAKEGNDFKQYD